MEMETKNKLRISSIVQDKQERRMLNDIKNNNIKTKILITLVHNMKLLNWLLKMMTAHLCQPATGHSNSAHIAEKRSWFEMFRVVSTLCRKQMTSIDQDFHLLVRMQLMEKGFIRLKELLIQGIIQIIAVKTIEWREVSAKIYTTIKIRKDKTAKSENHFKVPRKISLLKVTWTTELIEQMLLLLLLLKSRIKELRFKGIQILRLIERSNNLDKVIELVSWRPQITNNQLTIVKVNQD